ncbi:MAG: HD domain-containing protein [Treponema sp.]|jgi:poly(A) polymerase|nr:HD domain-containing protein [Treponema sp.]
MYDDSPLAILAGADFSVYFSGFSAIDAYLGCDSAPAVRLLTDAGVAELARFFEDLRFPGADIADAALDRNGCTFYFDCADTDEAPVLDAAAVFRQPSFQLLAFYQNVKTRCFYDPRGNYPVLRAIFGKPLESERTGNSAFVSWRENYSPGARRRRALMDGALILAKYIPCMKAGQIAQMAELLCALNEGPVPKEEEQRFLLAGLLTAPNPGLGLELLHHGGFIGEFWPELAVLNEVDHSKEFHPEGNVWKHTLETFRYRKSASGQRPLYDLRLSLGLLLHDVGKPIAEAAGSRRFDGHAELGERQARRFLERLGFNASLITDVCYLVRNHMLPAALPRLPLIRTGDIMASPLFPTLLELYRCDESSSFKGLSGYYESSAAYQSFLRYRRNPYRSADGKKRGRYRQV